MTDTLEDFEPQAPQLVNDNIHFEAKTFVLRVLFEKAASVLPTKDIMPVLKNFQVELSDGRMRVVATDLELSVISSTEMVNAHEHGTAVFPGKKMLEIIRDADDGDVEIHVLDGTARIAVGRTQWDVRLQDGSDYPPLPEIGDLNMVEIDRGKFLGALSSVRYAAATETVRHSLMMIDITKGKMRAADGVRFQQVDLGEEFPLEIQIPIGAVDQLVKLLRSTEVDKLKIGEGDHHLVFMVGTDVFVANKLIAQFPDIDKVLLQPALQNDQELTCDRQELLDAIKRVRINADPETSAVLLTLMAGTMVVSSQDKFGNRAAEAIDVGWHGPEGRRVVLNHRFVTDMLTMADAKTCHFFLGPDQKTKKSVLLLKDVEAGMLGTCQQMRADWVLDDTTDE